MAVPTYSDLATMRNSSAFIDRCTFSVVYFARYIINEDPATQNHQRRFDWARQAIQNPQGMVSGLLTAIAADNIFASQDPLDLGTTPDSGAGSVQAAVEATINSTVFQF